MAKAKKKAASTAKKNEEAEEDKALRLLNKLDAMIVVEQALTAKLEQVEPWTSTTNSNPYQGRVRPLPRTMEQVDLVLAVARSWAGRTSAPAGWNPQAPVVGFCTPNPLPHQLRGGALAALELQQAREQQQRQKDKQRRQQELQEEERRHDAEKQEEDAMEVEEEVEDSGAKDPKKREIHQHEHELERSKSDISRENHAVPRRPPPPRAAAAAPSQPSQDVSMNLSDSSSSEEDD